MQKLSTEQIKKIELDILITFADFCDKHNLKYYLGYGTLLGAVRHHGFIPWDDDIDVMMLREDYEKFHSLMCQSDGLGHLKWHAIENEKYHAPFGKLVDTRTCAGIYGGKTGNGLWVDVFAIDNYTKVNYKKNYFWRRVLIARDTKKFFFTKKGIAKLLLRIAFCWKSVKSIARNIRDRAVATPYSGKVCNMVWPTYTGEIVDIELFQDTSDVEFEGHFFKTVKNPNEYLTLLYGEYMRLPPVEKRVAHYVEAYWCGEKPCNY